MGFVMAAVVGLALFAGLAPITALALGIVAAGVVGIVSATRRGVRKPSAAEEIAAMMAPRPAAAPPAPPSQEHATAVDAMAPPDLREVDPEANMPRWRRPSLLEARHSDPSRQTQSYRLPMRFGDDQNTSSTCASSATPSSPLLDRPDEVLGLQISDLEQGDEVQVCQHLGRVRRGPVPQRRARLGPSDDARPARVADAPSRSPGPDDA